MDSVDRAANKLVVLGIDVTLNQTTRVEDKGEQRVASFNLGNIAAGDFVEIRGAELPAGSSDVVASRLERRRTEDEVRLRGIVDTVSRPGFTILGVTIQTTARTDFEGVSADDFRRRRRPDRASAGNSERRRVHRARGGVRGRLSLNVTDSPVRRRRAWGRPQRASAPLYSRGLSFLH